MWTGLQQAARRLGHKIPGLGQSQLGNVGRILPWAFQRPSEEATSDFDREKLQERVAELAGGVALMRAKQAVLKAGTLKGDNAEQDASTQCRCAPQWR